MGQLKLFLDSVHLERCYDDPDPYQCEPIYYTPWQILYPNHKAAVAAQLAEVIDLNRNVIELIPPDEAA